MIVLLAGLSSCSCSLDSAPVPFPDSTHFLFLLSFIFHCFLVSGCVTSAETVLIQEQSYEKLLARLLSLPSAITNNHSSSRDRQHPFHGREGREIIVVCLSPQSVAAIAQLLSIAASGQPADTKETGASDSATSTTATSSSSSNAGAGTNASPCITAAQVFLQVAGVLKRAGDPHNTAMTETKYLYLTYWLTRL